MEKRESESGGWMERLLGGLFRLRLRSAAEGGESASSVDEKLITALREAKNSDSVSVEDIAVIDSWLISLERYRRKVASGNALDAMDLADIKYIREKAASVILK